MKKVFELFIEKSELLLNILGMVAILLVLGIRFFLLDKGLIPSDDGWYYILMRDLPVDSSSRFHLLFNNIFQNNIYLNRLSCYFVMLAASIVFALGLKQYFEKVLGKHFPYIFCLGVLFLGQMYILDCPSFYYVNLNVSIMELTYGFMLLGLAKRNSWMQILTGFVICFLIPVMITNATLIPLTLVALFILSTDKWKDAGMFCLGIALFFVYYFIAVESPSEITNYVQSRTANVVSKGGEEYGLLFYFDWLYRVGVYYVRLAIIAFVFVMIPVFTANLKCKNDRLAKMLGFVIVFVAAYYFYKYTKPCIHFNGWWATDIYWIFVFAFLFRRKYDFKLYPVLLLFFITPLCLSFGTNVDFEGRQLEYLVFITPLVFLFASSSKKEKSIMFVSFVFLACVFVYSLFGFNWHMDYYLKQDTPVSSIGIDQNVKLEKKYIDELAFVKEHVGEGEACLMDNECWYVADLLELKPVYYQFRLPDIPEIEQIVDDATVDGTVLNVIYKDSRCGFVFDEMVNDSRYEIQKFAEGDNVVMRINRVNP